MAVKILDNGPDKDRVNLIVFAEGFTVGQETEFNAAVKSKIDYFFSVEPCKSEKYKFNVYSVFTPSQTSGINHPALLGPGCYGQPAYAANTYFGCSFDSIVGSSRIHRAIAPKSDQFVKDEIVRLFPLAAGKNNYLPIIICNTKDEGGLCSGSTSICTLSPYGNDTLIHECAGHSIGGLNDEYASGANTEGWNCTAEKDPTKVRWAKFIPPMGVVPANARFNIPSTTCKMNKVTDEFCVVCADRIKTGINFLITTSGGIVPTKPTEPVPAPPPITAPVLSYSNKTNSSVRINWNKQAADGYAFYKSVAAKPFEPAGTAAGDATYRVFQNLKKGYTYTFRVVLNKGGVNYESQITVKI